MKKSIIILSLLRYPLCVLVSAMALYGFFSNFLLWYHHGGRVNALDWIALDYKTRLWLWFDPGLLAFLYLAIAVIAWHFRKATQ